MNSSSENGNEIERVGYVNSRVKQILKDKILNKIVKERIEDLYSKHKSRIDERDNDYDSQKTERDEDFEYDKLNKSD